MAFIQSQKSHTKSRAFTSYKHIKQPPQEENHHCEEEQTLTTHRKASYKRGFVLQEYGAVMSMYLTLLHAHVVAIYACCKTDFSNFGAGDWVDDLSSL